MKNLRQATKEEIKALQNQTFSSGGGIYTTMQTYTKPLKTMLKYKVCQCPKCKNIQVTEAKERLKCKDCSRTSIFRSGGGWNILLFECETPRTASELCQFWMRHYTTHGPATLREVKERFYEHLEKNRL